MFNIHREFRSDESKIIPFQLLKPSVGYSSPSASESIISSELSNTAVLSIELPVAESFVVMLINTTTRGSDSSLDVAAIKTCPPGKNSVRFELQTGSYNIYLISKEFQNGYITETRDVVPETDVSSIFLEFRPPESISIVLSEVDEEHTLGLKRKPDANNTEDWYPFAGSYSSNTLNWLTTANSGSMVYYIDFKHLVSAVIDIFNKHGFNDPYQDASSLENSFKALQVKREIVQLYVDNASVINGNQEIRDFFFTQSGINLDFSKDLFYNSYDVADQANTMMALEWYGKLYMRSSIPDMGAGAHYSQVVDRVSNVEDHLIPVVTPGAIRAWEFVAGVCIDGPGLNTSERQEFSDKLQADFVAKRNSAKGVLEVYFSSLALNPSQYLDPLLGSDKARYEALEGYLINEAQKVYPAAFNVSVGKLEEITRTIDSFGNVIFATGSTVGLQSGHEATLQNIRFLKDKLSEVENDLWTNIINSNAVVFERVGSIEKAINSTLSTINPVISLDQAVVPSSDIEVFYSDDISRSNVSAKKLSTQLIDLSEGMKAINVTEAFKAIGNYAVIIKPKRYALNVDSVINGNVLQLLRSNSVLGITGPDDKYARPNSLFGWSVQLLDGNVDNPTPIGDVRKVISSSYSSDVLRIAISPANQITSALRVFIWNSFAPVLIDIKVKEHDEQTLSYSLYSKKEFNTETGLCTIYDANGNPWKRQTIGTRALSSEDKTIIEFRNPV